MAREKKDYRAILEDILAFSGGKRVLTVGEVAQYTGLSRPTVRKRYEIGRGGVVAPTLAMKLSGGMKLD